jgi:hypothetical protein
MSVYVNGVLSVKLESHVDRKTLLSMAVTRMENACIVRLRYKII